MGSVFLSIGSNLGDSLKTCEDALEKLESDHQCRIQSISKFYRTEPFGPVHQPWFINCAVKIITNDDPFDLLARCKDIETAFHRQRVDRWGPRTLDMDILLFNTDIIISQSLRIPHPELHKRKFVLQPMMDLDPGFMHPLLFRTIEYLFQHVDDPLKVVRV